jgi:hypothetical protein
MASQPFRCASASNNPTTYTCSTTPTINTILAGDAFLFQPDVTNTGAATLNINGVNATAIKKHQGTANLIAGDLQADAVVLVTMDNSGLLELSSPAGNSDYTGPTINTPTQGGIAYGSSATAISTTGACTALQLVLAGGTGTPTCIDFPQVYSYQVASCDNTTAAALVNYQPTQVSACDSNHTGVIITALPNAGTAAFTINADLPGDWDTTQQPYIKVSYDSRSNAAGTVVWTAASACTKADGSVGSVPGLSFQSEVAFASQTMTVANRQWAQSGQYTLVNSTNNCVPGGHIVYKMTLAGTASTSGVGVYSFSVTVPRLLVVQGN